MKKIILIMLFLFTITLLGCYRNDDVPNNNNNNDELIEFTLTTLSEYNGKEGRPAYIAVDGYVYDVSNSPHWVNGEHYSGIVAGVDCTETIDSSPHGRSVLNNLPRIGILIDE